MIHTSTSICCTVDLLVFIHHDFFLEPFQLLVSDNSVSLLKVFAIKEHKIVPYYFFGSLRSPFFGRGMMFEMDTWSSFSPLVRALLQNSGTSGATLSSPHAFPSFTLVLLSCTPREWSLEVLKFRGPWMGSISSSGFSTTGVCPSRNEIWSLHLETRSSAGFPLNFPVNKGVLPVMVLIIAQLFACLPWSLCPSSSRTWLSSNWSWAAM